MIGQRHMEVIRMLLSRQVSVAGFYELYPEDIAQDRSYIRRMLDEAIDSRDAAALEYLLCLRGYHRHVEPMDTHVPVLRTLLLEDWHRSHEYIVDALEVAQDQQAIELLCSSATRQLDYLDELDNLALQKKSVYAIAKIGGRKTVKTLAALAAEGPGEIQGLALDILEGKREDCQ